MAHPWVSADRGRIAVKCGPVLYCCEKAVDKWEDPDPELSLSEPVRCPDGTVTVGTTDGKELRLIEYRRWNNHGQLPMRTWFRQSGMIQNPSELDGREHRLYREYH